MPLPYNLGSSTYEILRLVLVVFQANLKLANRFVRCAKGFDAVPAKIVCGVFQVFLGAAQRTERFPDLRMRLGWVCRCIAWLARCCWGRFSPRCVRRGWGRSDEGESKDQSYYRQ